MTDAPAEFIPQHVFLAILAEARRHGWAGFRRPVIVEKFSKHVPRTTLYRWINKVQAQGLGMSDAEIIEAAMSGVPAKVAEVIKEVKQRAVATATKTIAMPVMPDFPSIGEAATAMTPLPVMEKIQACIKAAEKVMERSQSADGVVRNSKMLLAAAEQLRRCLDTAVKLQEAISDSMEIERFHQTILRHIATIDPEVAQRIIADLQDLNATWSMRND